MPRRYPPEFRRKVLDLVAAGRSVAEVAADLGDVRPGALLRTHNTTTDARGTALAGQVVVKSVLCRRVTGDDASIRRL